MCEGCGQYSECVLEGRRRGAECVNVHKERERNEIQYLLM